MLNMINISDKPKVNLAISFILLLTAVASYYIFLEYANLSVGNIYMEDIVASVLLIISFIFYVIFWFKLFKKRKPGILLNLILGFVVSILTILFLLYTAIFGIRKSLEIYNDYHYPIITSRAELLKSSGLSPDALGEVIKQVEIQRGYSADKILSIEKVNDTRIKIEVGEIKGPLNGWGSYCNANYANGKWVIDECELGWIS